MEKAFNLKDFASSEIAKNMYYYQKGKEIYTQNKKDISTVLTNNTSKDGILQANNIQQALFPQVNTDIFISHSSLDIGLAYTLAGYLYVEQGKTSFIDSAFWGNMYELEYNINNKYSRIDDSLFSYEKHDFIASNTCMLLATALSSMIKNTKYFIFLNTDISINDNKATNSPWIFFEICQANNFMPTTLLKKSMALDESKIHFEYTIDKYLFNFEELKTNELFYSLI